MKHVMMDLKVCEGCGGLWIRNGRGAGVYCRYCVVILAEFPAPRAKRATGRRRRTPAGLPGDPEMALSVRENGGAR
jgi:hypothetical protein